MTDLLVVSKEGSTLLVGRGRSEVDLSASRGGDGNNQSQDEEDGHDDKGKDPLEGNDLVEELSNTNRSSKNAEGETDGVILVENNEEGAVGKDRPNENVSKDAGNQVMGVRDHQSSIPVNGNKGPGEWCRNDWSVDEARVGVVAEVEGREIGKVEHQNNLSPVEVRSNEEHDEGEVQQVVGNKVATNARSCM